MEINNELKNLLQPLTDVEKQLLTESLKTEGCRDAIVLWNETIVDGHNRYEICNEYDIPFNTVQKEFEDIRDVKIWIYANQGARRNNTDGWKFEQAQAKKALLLEKGRDKQKETLGGYKHNSSVLSTIDKTENHNTQNEIATDLGWSTGKVAMADKIWAKAEPEVKEKIKSGESSFNQAYQEIKKTEKKEKLQEKKKQYEERIKTKNETEFKVDIFNTSEKFRVIYADPAWSYNDKQDTPQLGGAAKHYDTMSIKQICELPVKQISENDSVLFLWVTSPLLEDAFTVINSWGFKYKTSFVYDKIKHNMGHYNSVRHEFLLVCTKGNCLPDNKKLYDSVQSIERNDNHSEKPIEFLNIIDDLYNFGNKLEMFCRNIKKTNWYGWGNEI